MKKFFILTVVVVGCFVVLKNKTRILANLTFIKGSVELADNISKDLKPNSILYIIVKNDKGVMFAIKEIINPKFPFQFEINHKNVLYPDLTTLNIKLQAHINNHGEVGKIKSGDIYSENTNSIIINPKVVIKIDKVMY